MNRTTLELNQHRHNIESKHTAWTSVRDARTIGKIRVHVADPWQQRFAFRCMSRASHDLLIRSIHKQPTANSHFCQPMDSTIRTLDGAHLDYRISPPTASIKTLRCFIKKEERDRDQRVQGGRAPLLWVDIFQDMELLSLSHLLPCKFSSSNVKLSENRLSLKPSKLSRRGKRNFLISALKSSSSPRRSHQSSYEIKNFDGKEGIRLLSFLEGLHSQDETMAGDGTCNYHMVDGNVSLKNIPKVDQSEKILIPSLPNESKGNHGSQISSCYWEWKPKLSVHYEKSGTENLGAPGVLFLPGFGVGAFHYEKQLKDLGRDYRVWALDFLGQGRSLPSEDPAPCTHNTNSEEPHAKWGFGIESEPWASELVYSIDLWRDQVQHFVEQVIGEPVYVVGNSLGGFVAMYFAACNPQLVKGVTLLNATPFWGFLPNPVRSPGWSRIFPWAGTFPLPSSVRKLTEIVWQKISEPSNIEEILKQVYADHSTKVDKVFSRIIEIVEHPAAAASFASIMFAPKGQLSFHEALARCELQNVPICLMYGKDDPWVRPIWGLKVKRQLPQAPYYEISPAGHCPHDEVPEVVNYLLRGWMKSLESEASLSLPLLEDPELTEKIFCRELEYIREEGTRKSVKVRYFGSKVSLWDQMVSFLASSATKLLFSGR